MNAQHGSGDLRGHSDVMIQNRVQRLEDAASIENAKLRQMMAFDAVINDGASITALEAELSTDFEWRCEQFGSFSGLAAFRKFVERYAQRVSLSVNFLSGSTTEIAEGRSRASGKWVVFQPFTLDGDPWLLAGRSKDTFSRQGESWRVATTELSVEILSPWTADWGKNPVSKEWIWDALTH